MPKPIERGPNSWQVKIRRKLPDGTVSNINRTFDTREEAQSFIDITVGRVAGHEVIDKKVERSTSLRQILERFRDEITVKKENVAARGQEASMIRKWLTVEWVDWPVVSIEPAMIAEWRDEQLDEGAAGTTVKNPMNLLSKVFRIARTEWGIRVDNPVNGVARPPSGPGREAFLRSTEEKTLLAECGNGPWPLKWCTRAALLTAMRAGEIRRLEWKHIDLVNGVVHLPKTKNGERRDVPLVLPGALELFAEMAEKIARRDDGYVFGHPDKTGAEGGYTATMLTSAFANAVDRTAKVDESFATLNSDLRFHDLRHVATTRLAPLHRDALDLSKTTGHKTLSVLARYYNEAPAARAARLRKVAKAMETA